MTGIVTTSTTRSIRVLDSEGRYHTYTHVIRLNDAVREGTVVEVKKVSKNVVEVRPRK
jgi:hypothetical protein